MGLGTPKTLKQAIVNAGKQSDDVDVTFAHVKDFLAQKFATAYLNAGTTSELHKLQELFQVITSEVDGE